MALNATNATLTPSSSEAEYPYQTAVLTACYLVGALQIGYYGFYILFMGTDSVFKASRAFDYEDFDCQRKAVPQGSEELENNANSGCIGRDSATMATETATATATANNNEADDNNSNCDGGGGASIKTVDEVVEFDQQAEETDVGDGDGAVGSSSSSSRHRRVLVRKSARGGGRSGRNAAMTVRGGGRGFAGRGPVYRLMQSCSCMLVYKSDDEDEEDEDDEDGESNNSYEYEVDQDESDNDKDDESEDSYDEVCSDHNSAIQGAKDRADGDAAKAAEAASAVASQAVAPCSSGRQRRKQPSRHRREGDLRKSACAKRHPSGRRQQQHDSHC